MEIKTKNWCFRYLNDKKLLQKYQTIWTKIEGLKDAKLNTLPVMIT